MLALRVKEKTGEGQRVDISMMEGQLALLGTQIANYFANGVSAFPDPNASGELTIDAIANGSSVDTSTAAFKKAIGACRDLQPGGFMGRKRSAQEQRNGLELAQCMRDNGVKDFPDPTNDAPLIDTTRIPSAAGRGARSIPGFQAAVEKCRDALAGALEGQRG